MEFAALGIAIIALVVAAYAVRQSRQALLLADEAYDMAGMSDFATYEMGRYVIDHMPAGDAVEMVLVPGADLFGLTET